MKKISVFILLLLIVFTNTIFSQKTLENKKKELSLIPYPKNITLNNDKFEFTSNTVIILNDENDQDDIFSANQLIEEVQKNFKYKIKIGKLQTNPTILLTRINIDQKEAAGGKKNIAELLGRDGYMLKIAKDRIVIAGVAASGVFYGVQTLKQLIRANRTGNKIQGMEIIDWPKILYRGWQDDISRGPIPTMNFLKEQIRIMSEYKQNLFTLYTEHVFKLKKHPAIAPSDGITEDEIKELSAYAKKYHVDLVGNFQSFGHFGNILKVPGYENLGETNWVISPAKEESYKFLTDVFSEIAPAYSSKFFNINCDETEGIGSGASKKMVDSIGVEGVYAYHINRLNQILKPYGKTLMMWGDIAAHNPKIIAKLPADLIVLSWGYDAKDKFDDAIIPFRETGLRFFVCPGTSCWSRIWPDQETAIINISNYIRDGAKYEAMGVLNTTWDDGGENLFNNNWYPLIWGADCSWAPASTEKDENPDEIRKAKLDRFNKSFDPLFFGISDNKITTLMEKFSSLRKYKQSGGLMEGKFRSGISLSPYLTLSDEDLKESGILLSEIIELVKNINKKKISIGLNRNKIDYALFALEKAMFIMKRDVLQNDLSNMLKDGTDKMISINPKLKELKILLEYITKEYARLWKTENRKWWLDKNITTYEEMIADLKSKESEVMINPSGKIVNNSRSIALKTLSGKYDIYYTMDGKDPDKNSIKYISPFIINKTTLIKASALVNNKFQKFTQKEIKMNLSFGKNVTYGKFYSYKYAAGGSNALVDGILGSTDFHDGKWQGFEGDDMEAVIDLEETNNINKICINFVQAVGSWVFLPIEVEFALSENGKDFKTVYSEKSELPSKEAGRIIKEFKTEIKEQKARYIKVKAKNMGVCPDWHSGAGGKAWIFADEITIE